MTIRNAAIILAIGAATMSATAGQFEDLGIPVVKAGLMGSMIGPDAKGEMTKLYFNFNQTGAPLFLVQVDPITGESKQFNSPAGPGAWGFIVGPDKCIYLGTWDGGLILRFDPKHEEKGIEVIGKPSESESYIWMYTIGKDGKLYGCTYGNCKLISYDPATGKMEDLGRMDPTEDYSRSVATGKDGWIYVGVGMVRGSIIAFNPETREHKLAIPESHVVQDCGAVWTAMDGNAYGRVGAHCYRFVGGVGEEIKEAEASSQFYRWLPDGRVLTNAHLDGWYELYDPATKQTERKTFKYRGAGSAPFLVGEGPEGVVYGSTAMPLEMFAYDPRTGESKNPGNPTPVGGEIYSFGHLDGKLYLCAYPGSWLSIYDPHKPWDYGTTADKNPFGFGNMGDGHLRPRAMLVAKDRRIYIGSYPPYGQLGGAMGVYDPAQNKVVENYRNLIPNQAITALVQDETSGLIFGGTSIAGGGGSRPSEPSARIFAWDPVKRERVNEFVPIEGCDAIVSMAAAKGRIFAMVSGAKLVVYNVAKDQVECIKDVPLGYPHDISLGLWKDGLIYGLTNRCIFTINPDTFEAKEFAKPSCDINCGWAMTDTGIYFGSGVQLMRWAW